MTTTKTTPKKCNNFLLESDGYCAKCGGYHFKEAFGRISFYAEPVQDVNPGYSDMSSEPDAEVYDMVYDPARKCYMKTRLTSKRLVDGKPVDVQVMENGEVTYLAKNIRDPKKVAENIREADKALLDDIAKLLVDSL